MRRSIGWITRCFAVTIALPLWTACDDDDSGPPATDARADVGLTTADGGGDAPDAGVPIFGGPCDCDADCPDVSGHAAACVGGICMTRASADCSGPGSTAECPAGAQCWGMRREGEWSWFCFPDCASHACAGVCDETGSCMPGPGMGCDPACGYCVHPILPCASTNPAGACAEGRICAAGACADKCSSSALEGYCHPGFQCSDGVCLSGSGCGTWQCTAGEAACKELIAMPGAHLATDAQAVADGYYLSLLVAYNYLRRDLTLLIRWAACELLHRYPDTAPIQIGDLSQADGTTPGCPDSCRHVESVHNGHDFDAAYLQTDGSNNLQIICGDGSDENANSVPGQFNDGYRCTTETNVVDVEKQLRWMSLLAHHPGWRVAGIDSTLYDDFIAQARALYNAGEIDAVLLERLTLLGYQSDNGFDFHHHHTHFSFRAPPEGQ